MDWAEIAGNLNSLGGSVDNMGSANSTSAMPFASRVMMDIMLSGLKLHQLNGCGVSFEQNLAKVPLATKREFLRKVSDELGLDVSVKLGRGVVLHLEQPLGRVLLSQKTISSLFARWQRLERYVHANHYTEIELHDRYAIVQHLSRTKEEPHLEEDLAVLGLICALVAQSGASDVELFTGDNLEQLVYSYTSNQVNPHALKPNKYWKIRWQNTDDQELSFDVPKEMGQTWKYRVQESIGMLGLFDCSLENVATHLCTSVRSLQRHLAFEGIKFAQLVQNMRVNQAAKMMLEGDSCLAEIGFLCGFSDQAHFTRVFTQWNGMSPKAYLAIIQ
ncbi:helix-turn-helix transcriptional regulator [Vibrio mytili]|uniref:helix-turn-helix transcriptional regulator n=1 Tax=Vibrio mytili TaxID=50718 RepID=UPI002F4203D9